MNDTDLRENLIVHKEIDTGLNEAYNEVACSIVDKIPNEIVDIKEAMDLILSQQRFMLNGQILSDDTKIALANALNLGLQYAEQMQKKEK